ncbi:hypothetical protein F511_24835 [Dorcoceras hygrometricum]|uniref:Uncharacterized protein n=1 Tax=Dorcoceras hygrometricum TaxID=472368 RepID=A0A2Z7AN26_9LAMI|nr:hypothetical protein F511_24835 [Dorcoceras hygrometricum]
MSVIRWCSAAARRMTAAAGQRAAFSSLATWTASPTASPILCGLGIRRLRGGRDSRDRTGTRDPKRRSKSRESRIRSKCPGPLHGLFLSN